MQPSDERLLMKRYARLLAVLTILLSGFLLRLSHVYSSGFSSDMHLFVQWARLMARGGLNAVYERTLSAYPPLGTALLLPVGMMCPQCDISAAPTTRELFVLRLLSTGFDLLSATTLFRLGRKARHIWAGLGAACLYSLFPIMVVVSGWWGQNDSWVIFLMLMAGMFLMRGQPVPAWASLALSVLIKLQAIILLPVFIAGTWRWFGWRRLVVGGATFLLVLALFCLPVLAEGELDHFISAITLPIRQDPVSQKSHITLGGHNIWAGIARLKHLDAWGSYRHTIVPGMNFYAAGMSLLILGLTLVTVRILINSNPNFTFAAMATSWLIFFQFALGAGIRYLIPTTVFSLVVALEHPVWWIPCLGLHFTALLSLQDTIGYAEYPSLWISLPGGVAVNVILTMALSLVAFGLFFVQTGPFAFRDKRFKASRLERVLTGIGCIMLAVILGIWLRQNVNAQHQLERVDTALTNSLHREISDGADVLVVNWPREIIQASPSTGFLAPTAGIFPPSLEETGAFSTTAVIYPPWTEVVKQVHGWDADYHGYYVTAEEMIERSLDVERIVVLNIATDAPLMLRLAELSDLAAGTIPVAHFGQQAHLINARMEYHDRTVFVHLGWNVVQQLPDNTTVFGHILGPDGELIAQVDGDTVNNLVPLGRWYLYPSKILRETRVVALPEDAPRGAYTAAVGLYNRSTLERMAVSCEDQRCENQAYMLAPVHIDE